MKKGFTLVELLGVVIILSIISLITIPPILEYVNKSRISSYRTSVQTVIDAAKEYVSKNEVNNDFPDGGLDIVQTDLKLKKNKFKNGIIDRNKDGEIVAINVYNGTYCANGTKQKLVVEKASSLEECETIDVTAPTLKVKTVKITSNKIMLVSIASDKQSGIKDYKYCIGEECSGYIKSNNYEFSGLKAGQTYEITVTTRNNNSGRDGQYTSEITEKEVKLKVTTLSIEEPTFELSSNSYSGSREITINYGSIKEGYIYGYEFIDEEGNKEQKEVTEESVKIEVAKNGTLKAYIRKDQEEVSNEISIIGIDISGPVVYVVMNDNWEKSKQITVITKETGSGLSSKAYSYDGGKSWTSNNKRTYQENGKIELVVRDKMGNQTSKYKVCKDDSLNNCYESEELIINKVDREPPICVLKGNGQEGTKNWFRSDVNMTMTFEDKESDGLGNKIDGSGVVKQNIDNKKLTRDGKYLVTGTVEDLVGNKGTCSLEVGVDKTPPTIEITISGTSYGSGYKSGARVAVACKDQNAGVTGGKTLTLTTKGTNTVSGTCTDIAGNQVSDSKNYLIYVNTPDAVCGYATCQNSACGVSQTIYKSCSTSNCGTYQYACRTYQYACGSETYNCRRINSGCKTYGCYLYGTCANGSKCGWIAGSDVMPGDSCDSSGHYTTKSGNVGSCTPRRCQNSSCGSVYTTGSVCNNKNSRRCVEPNTIITCDTRPKYCTGTDYCTANNTCRNSVCGIDYYIYNSCQTPACGYATCWHI